MIREGTKKEEYRETTPYWCARLALAYQSHFGQPIWCMQRKFSEIEFTLGYPKKEDLTRRISFKNPRIRIDKGKVEWGAENGKLYFVITWDETSAP